jgi:predicted Fe-S protein YdhL (DUF1289 family)
MQPINSPCQKICTLHPEMPLCTGCGRTLDEIEQWLALSPQQRIGLIEVARQRLKSLRDQNRQMLP